MLLESIKLHNFRQYKDTSLDFAQDTTGKNVTIIIGENGSGKTTFLQSFSWCLYGTTTFKDKIVLNKDVAYNMTPENPANVSVELKLQHGENRYVITRTQKFIKDNQNNVKSNSNPVCEIKKIDSTGNCNYIDATKRESEINSILQKELKDYFFFDGERIDTMGKEISGYKKTEEFAEAVKSLLGLYGIQKAIEHLNGGPKNSVIGKYNQIYNSSSNEELKRLSNEIANLDDNILTLEERISDIEKQNDKAIDLKERKQEELKKYKSSEKLQKEKEVLEKEINHQQENKTEYQKDICREFNINLSSILSISLIKKSFEILKNLKIDDTDIPNITNKTIQYLIDHKKCLCGACIEEGSNELKEISKWFDVLPPKSIGNMVSDFKHTARDRIDPESKFESRIDEKLKKISKCNDTITDKEDLIRSIDSKLNGNNVEEEVRTISNKITDCEKTIRKNTEDRRELDQEIGAKKSERERKDTQRKELALTDAKNGKIEICKAYAKDIFDKLSEKYKCSETEVRNRLEKNMNEIFTTINNGDLSVRINDKYQIDVIANNINGMVETSEGQSISVIFAFITSMIKMSRENRNSKDKDKRELSAEIYPLVMDAPLSKFDKKHIKAVCETIPSLTEQVIIFIKDTDGDLAKEYMNDKIGKSHRFRKINETETVLE